MQLFTVFNCFILFYSLLFHLIMMVLLVICQVVLSGGKGNISLITIVTISHIFQGCNTTNSVVSVWNTTKLGVQLLLGMPQQHKWSGYN